MRTSIIVFLLSLLSVFGQAPPYQRQFFTTNTDPVVQAVAGSNVFVTYTLVGQTRTYTIDASGGTNIVTTNIFYTTNNFYTTNYFTNNFYETNNFTNNFYTTNYFTNEISITNNFTNTVLIATNQTWDTNLGPYQVDGYTQGVYSLRLGDTNYFRMLVGGEAYGIKVYSNYDSIILSNLYPNIYWFANTLGPTGNQNTATGYVAAGSISNNYNVAIRGILQMYGYESNYVPNDPRPFIEFRTSGLNQSNTFVGTSAGESNYNGFGNTYVGFNAGAREVSGYYNTIMGNGSGQYLTSAGDAGNTLIGAEVMSYPGFPIAISGNTMVGWQACQRLINGVDNVFVGKYSGQNVDYAKENTCVGAGAGGFGNGAHFNTALGNAALGSAGTPNWNIGIGHSAGYTAHGSNNIIIGNDAARSAYGASNIVIGVRALPDIQAQTGHDKNIIIGSMAALGLTNGSANIMVGTEVKDYSERWSNLRSNLFFAIEGRTLVNWNPTNLWRFEDSLNSRYWLRATQGLWLGYSGMGPVTNTYYTNSWELNHDPATNIQFRLLVPTNIVTLVWSNGVIVSNLIYGTTGDALINVPFYTASSSTNSPAWNEFVTKDYVDTHAGGGATNFVYQNYGFMTTNGGTFGGIVYGTNATAPASNELVTAQWVRNIFGAGVPYYNTTNLDTGTNTDMPNQQLYQFSGAIPLPATRTYATTDFLTNNGYIGAVVTTNRFQELSGAVLVNSYIGFNGGGGGPTLTIHPEIYYSYDKTNWYGDYAAGNESIIHGTTNLYQWLIDVPPIVSTNAAGFYIERRFKVGTVTGTGTRTVYVLIGTNSISGTTDASHVNMPSPTANAGNAYLAANQTFTGDNVFQKTILSSTNALVGPTNYIDMSKPYGDLIMSAITTITNFANINANYSQSAVRFITNSTASDLVFELSQSLSNTIATTDGLRKWTVTNKSMGVFSVTVYGNRFTNAVFRNLW